MKKKLSKLFLIIFLITSIVFSINIVDKIYYQNEKEEKLSLYYEKESNIKDTKDEDKEIFKKEIDLENEYIGIINIPSIGLKHGFYDEVSTNNNLKSGIKTIKDDMDNVLVLASHSGRSNIAKFNDLRKMIEGDKIELSYNNRDYRYIFDHSYKVDKTGHVFVKYDTNKKALILITCDLNDNSKQVVYVSYMI